MILWLEWYRTSISDGFAPTVPEFLIDKFEVTNEQYKEFVDTGGYTNAEFWDFPVTKDGEPISSTDLNEASGLSVGIRQIKEIILFKVLAGR